MSGEPERPHKGNAFSHLNLRPTLDECGYFIDYSGDISPYVRWNHRYMPVLYLQHVNMGYDNVYFKGI